MNEQSSQGVPIISPQTQAVGSAPIVNPAGDASAADRAASQGPPVILPASLPPPPPTQATENRANTTGVARPKDGVVPGSVKSRVAKVNQDTQSSDKQLHPPPACLPLEY